MNPAARQIYESAVEREIIDRLAAAGLILRFDRVVRSLVRALKSDLADVVPEGQTLLLTITAPVKLPAKTVALLGELARGSLSSGASAVRFMATLSAFAGLGGRR